jgi:hypothetical protein
MRCSCGSYALNIAPESGLCDVCYWRTKYEGARDALEKKDRQLAEIIESIEDRNVLRAAAMRESLLQLSDLHLGEPAESIIDGGLGRSRLDAALDAARKAGEK